MLFRKFKGLFVILLGLLALGALILWTPAGNDAIANIVSNTRLEGYAKSLGIEIHKKSPPLPTVTSEASEIPVVQSSYCWGTLGCGEYAGGKLMLEGKSATLVPSGSAISIRFDYKPKPTQLNVYQYLNDTAISITLRDGHFDAPKESGVYYYGISAYWTSDDGKYSKGDTSSVFVIEVK
ncbi:hypothetical protein H1230_24190 [Paenibacillus sp. 19GGS1-52]|uniref:hypothetical protein n=1 Tax=Paenibacillus sp. 19GGS1-52 TaxID=2758563 RepID=UPI001EFABD1C|nr:hypothetical protein [Paenibacillus sp. 19GGS1-52]ULO06113.1 hypothetical protein H1230_24190 [Paenibacillus sp. 19GGS1-52]